MDNLVDWFYGQVVGFLGNFFSQMGNMGVELFDLAWVQAIVLFFSRLAWALFGVSVVVSCFQFGIMYVSGGRGNLQQTAISIIKGFLAVSLFTIAPVRLYALSVSLQGTLSAGITGYGTSVGEVGKEIVEELGEIDTLSEVLDNSYFGLGVITSPIMIVFCVILMAYAVIKVFFANLKRGGILLIQIAVGSLYMFSIPRGYEIIREAKRGECLYRCGTDRHILKVVAPEYKSRLFKRLDTGQNPSQNPQGEEVPK